MKYLKYVYSHAFLFLSYLSFALMFISKQWGFFGFVTAFCLICELHFNEIKAVTPPSKRKLKFIKGGRK